MVEVDEGSSEIVASSSQIVGSNEGLIEHDLDLALVDADHSAGLAKANVRVVVVGVGDAVAQLGVRRVGLKRGADREREGVVDDRHVLVDLDVALRLVVPLVLAEPLVQQGFDLFS